MPTKLWRAYLSRFDSSRQSTQYTTRCSHCDDHADGDADGQVLEASDSGKRYPSAYFRVGFFGDLFEPELRNSEFIYKMPPLTRLAQTCEHLQTFFRSRFGDRVEVRCPSHHSHAPCITPTPLVARIAIPYHTIP